MIVCRRPVAIHDVDLIGAAALAVVGLAAWWLVVAPWQQTWAAYRDTAARRGTAELRLREEAAELERFERGLAQLDAAVAAQVEQIPRAAAVSRLLRNMTDIAQDARLEILSVAPQPAQRDGDHLVCDIDVAGRGRSHDFLVFLDRLAQENACQSLKCFSIVRPASAADAVCELTWALRLYLLPDEEADRSGGSS